MVDEETELIRKLKELQEKLKKFGYTKEVLASSGLAVSIQIVKRDAKTGEVKEIREVK